MHFYIGTSGWSYSDWQNFYPKDLASKDLLPFYAQRFNSVELNVTFYRMVRASTFANWAQTSAGLADFVFSVKLLQRFTRDKKLSLNADDILLLRQFLGNASSLGEKLGPILVQLPPSFKINLRVLDEFLQAATSVAKELHAPMRFAVEFRHESWLQQEVYAILTKYNAAMVISDSARWPTEYVTTADFLYVRLHGKPRMFFSLYTSEELTNLCEQLMYLGADKAFVYFNNTMQGHAADNALLFQKICNS